MAKSKVSAPAKEAIQPETQKSLVMTVKDRLLFAEFFPERGNLITQMQVKDISSKITVGQEEQKRIGFKSEPGGRLFWDQTKSKDVKIAFTEAEITFLKEQVERLDKLGQFTVETAEVAKKIKGM